MKKILETLLKTDAYKVAHKNLYPKGLKMIFSNFTPRSGNWAKPNLGFVVASGMRYVINNITGEIVKGLLELNEEQAIKLTKDYEYSVNKILGIDNFDGQHIFELWNYVIKNKKLPLKIRALKENSISNYKVPILTIYNNDSNFCWLVNYLETWISSELWPIITASTTAFGIKKQLLKFAKETGTQEEFVNFQAHDFSFRGMEGYHGAKLVGIGHLQHFIGSDNLPAILATNKGNSVIATEHSIMSVGTKSGEFNTYKRLIENNPKGILSIVSDTWNIYNVCDNILPKLKKEIKNRDGSFVIRPDSGDAIKVLLGGQELKHPNKKNKDIELARKGLFKIIEQHFGYKINKKGFKELPIGFLWGDGMTPEKIDEVFTAMKEKGYASSNLVIGVGSYAYQLQTRDTHGFAMKATYAKIDEKSFSITKDPITDSGVKKSAKGLLVVKNGNLYENSTWEDYNSELNELKEIY